MSRLLGQGAVALWIARLALETESVGLNPGHGEVVFFWAFFFFLLLLSPPSSASNSCFVFSRPRFQLNLVLFKMKDIPELSKLPEELVLPFMWAEDGFGEPSVKMAEAIRLEPRSFSENFQS